MTADRPPGRVDLQSAEHSLADANYRELQKAYEQQRAIVHAIGASSPDFTYIFDREHRFVYASPALLKRWGQTLEETVGKNFEELGYPPALVILHKLQLDEVLTGKTVSGSNEYLSPAGDPGHYEYTFVPVFNDNGKVVTIVGTTRDISARLVADHERAEAAKRAEAEEKVLAKEREAVKAAQHELAELVRLSPVPTVIWRGPEHVYSVVNEAHDRMLGKRVFGKPMREVHTKEEAGDAPAMLDRVYRTGEPFISKEVPYTIHGEDGRLRHIWIHEWFYPFRDVAGNVVGVLGVAQDVTEEVRARQEVSTVLNAIPAFVTRVNTEERFVFIAQSNEKYFGPPEKILGRTMRDYFGNHYDVFKDHVAAALRGEAVEFEWSSPPLRDGFAHHFVVNFSPERSPDGIVQGFITCVFNIDGLKLAEAKLNASYLEANLQKARLEEERELRERFVATLSHDLRNPLSAAKMGAELLTRHTNDFATITRVAALVANNIDRADQMIRDLLDANRIQAGEPLPVEIEACVLNEIAADTIGELVAIHGDRFALRADSRIEGYWSKSGVRRVLENLCNNAIKYGAADRTVTVSISRADDTAKIEVHNEGSAIPLDDQATLFDQYRRTKSARTGGQKGWGLGLTLCMGIANAHGGSVDVESSAELGTTFRVNLPVDARQSTQ